jgi:uncharacterized protein
MDSKLNEIVLALKERFHPIRLFLYGSRTRGNSRPDSDYDFVIVVPDFDLKNRLQVMSEVSSNFRAKFGVEVQCWVYSQAEFDDWKDEFSSIPETALNTGREIELG